MDAAGNPKPAATILTLRDGSDGVEVLMLRRNLNSDFVGGAYVFPGGGVDDDDRLTKWRERVTGLDEAAAHARLGLASDALSYYVAALREMFEEAGLLLAHHRGAGPLDSRDDALRARLADHRRALNARETSMWEIVETEDLVLDMSGMSYLAHWVTPVGPPRRYDTRFFVAEAPRGQVAACDEGETIADTWVRPTDALAAHARGDLDMIFPTIKTLESLVPHTTVAAVRAFAEGQARVATVTPRIEHRDGKAVIVTDEEEFFPEHDPTTMRGQSSKE